MTDKVECEIFIVMDDSGNYAVGVDEDEAHENFENNIVGYPRRMSKVIVKMTPAVLTEATVDIPDDSGTVEVEAA